MFRVAHGVLLLCNKSDAGRHCQLAGCAAPDHADLVEVVLVRQVSGPAALDSILTYSALSAFVPKTASPAEVRPSGVWVAEFKGLPTRGTIASG